MKKVEFNKKNSNPFYGMKNTLKIYQRGSRGESISSYLQNAWEEADNDDKKKVLFSVLFFIGDVTNRQHNIFKKTVDNGGNAQRNIFRNEIIPFLHSKIKPLKKKQRLEFINLIAEYTVLDNVIASRVQTDRGTTNPIRVINMIKLFGVSDLSSYISNIILKGTTFQKMCVAKFLIRPRFSKRAGKDKMLPETFKTMKYRIDLLKEVSKKAKLPFEVKEKYIDFNGYYEWRKKYNKDFESVLFSSKKILKLDREEFFELLEKMPSQARFRVKTRLYDTEKWRNLLSWYEEWEEYKIEKQAEQRDLEERISEGIATEDDLRQLKDVKKQAKVNVGANSFDSLFADIVKATVDKIKIQPFLDKINLPYNTLVFVDSSGSMNWSGNNSFRAIQFAGFLTTICLMKNPDAEARNLVGLFSSTSKMYNGITKVNYKNRLLNSSSSSTLQEPLINPKEDFLTNMSRIQKWLAKEAQFGSTDISSIPDFINKWVDGDSDKIEQLQRYPVWTLISDGEFNNMYSPESSFNDFMKKCQNYFGFKPFVILIDVGRNDNIDRFSGIDNLMMVPPNPANIEMFLTNFKDLDDYDIYTPLESIFRSNRYEPIRNFLDTF